MKILVIGQGGREHALVRAFALSPSVSQIHVIPGSSGIAREALCHNLDWRDFEGIHKFCVKNEISFVVIGPEDPLVAGLSDFLRDRGVLVVGPSKEAAQLEGSKIFAKKFMQTAKVPTSFFEEVHSVSDVVRLSGRFTPPYVLKADGLAAGKGVFICKTLEELKNAAHSIFEKQILGSAGSKGLLEQFTPGWELSFLILTNGNQYQILPLAQDHKRLKDHDEGPNTGGMGTVAPLHLPEKLLAQIEETVIRPTLQTMQEQNFLYRGVLFVGLMINDKGPSVLEFNCRFGDPETQVILPLLDHDLGELLGALSKGEVLPLKVKNMWSSCVVMATPGYPDAPVKGGEISGDVEHSENSAYFLHAGTIKQDSVWRTNGGRVLCSIGLGSKLSEALKNAYAQAGRVNWEGLQKRTDIGHNLVKNS